MPDSISVMLRNQFGRRDTRIRNRRTRRHQGRLVQVRKWEADCTDDRERAAEAHLSRQPDIRPPAEATPRVLRKQGLFASRQAACTTACLIFLACLFVGDISGIFAQQAQNSTVDHALYRQPQVPIEERIDDLMRRMTLEEKARQLDMYAGAPDLVSRHTDSTHA